MKNEKSFYVLVFSIAMLFGLLAFYLFQNSSLFSTRLLKRFVMLPLSSIAAAGFVGLGWLKTILRFYLYGLAVLIAIIIGPLLHIAHWLYFAAPGMYMMV